VLAAQLVSHSLQEDMPEIGWAQLRRLHHLMHLRVGESDRAERRPATAARSSALSAAEVAAKKRKPPKEPEQQTTTGSARGEASAARDNAPRTDVKAEHAGFEE
jgi:hypothetical protein